jgi:hypothetical protein
VCLSNLSRSSPPQKNLYEYWDEVANEEFPFFGSQAKGEAQDSAHSFGLVPVGALFAMIIPIASEDGHFTWNM